MADPAKEITKYIWSLGDYEEVARTTEPVATNLIEAAGVDDGDRVLDIATGNGNVAIAAAQRGARVTGCDLTPAMLDLARARAERDGVEIEFDEADAEALPYGDRAFDHVLSTFGVMFAPDPDLATREMFRVLEPGGTVGVASWTAEGFLGKQTAIILEYAPGGGPGGSDPLLWGTEDFVRERLRPYASDVRTEPGSVHDTYASWDAVVAYYEHNLGPTMAIKQFIEPDRYAEMLDRLHTLFDSEDAGGGDGYDIELPYLLVTATKTP